MKPRMDALRDYSVSPLIPWEQPSLNCDHCVSESMSDGSKTYSDYHSSREELLEHSGLDSSYATRIAKIEGHLAWSAELYSKRVCQGFLHTLTHIPQHQVAWDMGRL